MVNVQKIGNTIWQKSHLKKAYCDILRHTVVVQKFLGTKITTITCRIT